MTGAPERISAIKLVGAKVPTFLGGKESPPFDATTYVRADLIDVRIAEAVARERADIESLFIDKSKKAKAQAKDYQAEGCTDGSVDLCMSEALSFMEAAAAIRARQP